MEHYTEDALRAVVEYTQDSSIRQSILRWLAEAPIGDEYGYMDDEDWDRGQAFEDWAEGHGVVVWVESEPSDWRRLHSIWNELYGDGRLR